MTTFFGKPDVQYNRPNDDGDIMLPEFLNSCNGIVEFVTFFGTAFLPVKNDIQGNVVKIRRVHDTNPARYTSIRKLIEAEAEASNSSGQMGVATDALMWLKRALEFVCTFLMAFVNDHHSGKPADSLVNLVDFAYERTLKKHHGFIQKGLFSVILHATPRRKDFIQTMTLGRPDAADECISDLELYLPNMRANVTTLMEIFYQRGIENYNSSSFRVI